jgi:hypothetical protein
MTESGGRRKKEGERATLFLLSPFSYLLYSDN